MDTNSKGNIAHTQILAALAKVGKTVLIPITEHGRYDLVVEENGKFSRVQCKSGVLKDGCVIFRCFSVTVNTKETKHRPYSPEEVDYFGVYCIDNDKCYLVPCDGENTGSITLRIDPPKINITKGIRWAKDYEISGCNSVV